MGYREEFEKRYPGVEYGEIHHEIEQEVRDLYPGVEEHLLKPIDHISNLRGIPQKRLRTLHKSIIARFWNYYYTKNGELLERINTEIDRRVETKIAKETEEEFSKRVKEAVAGIENIITLEFAKSKFHDEVKKLFDAEWSLHEEKSHVKGTQIKKLNARRSEILVAQQKLWELGINGYRDQLIEKEKECVLKEMKLEREKAQEKKSSLVTKSSEDVKTDLLEKQTNRSKLRKDKGTCIRKRRLLYERLAASVGTRKSSLGEIRVGVRGTMEKASGNPEEFLEQKGKRHELNEKIKGLEIETLVNELEEKFPGIEAFKDCKVKIKEHQIARMKFKGFSSEYPPKDDIKKFMVEVLEKEAFKIDIYLQNQFKPNLSCTYCKSKYRENKIVGIVCDVPSLGKKGDKEYRGYTLEEGKSLKQIYVSMDFDT